MNTGKLIRIRRSRARGWIMPDNTIYVGRPTKWGNPFVIGIDGTAQECVKKYADELLPYRHHGEKSRLYNFFISESILTEIERELRGKNLCCWCPLLDVDGMPYPCHADVLLELANA